ncbi:50S ribosomal protein L5 [Candidatus Pacearchaeota archaeon CG10_big_fil_rev_8_21_14_0_10_32_42]|nr:MAG: 50S ribosomal protein L5 [Candidatus Pacearchaeota archaeon CG10_big_fil_rev_8_21_14_0_10_32_42]
MENKMKEQKINPMRKIKIEKVVLSIGGTGDYLNKGHKLLEIITSKKPSKTVSRKRIPSFGVRPGLETGTVVTIRKDAEDILRKLLIAIENKLKLKQMSENNFSFGIHEYIEIPGMEYHREIGIMGLDVTVVFKRAGRRVRLKKMKSGKIPKKQIITPEEIVTFMKNKFDTRFTK